MDFAVAGFGAGFGASGGLSPNPFGSVPLDFAVAGLGAVSVVTFLGLPRGRVGLGAVSVVTFLGLPRGRVGLGAVSVVTFLGLPRGRVGLGAVSVVTFLGLPRGRVGLGAVSVVTFLGLPRGRVAWVPCRWLPFSACLAVVWAWVQAAAWVPQIPLEAFPWVLLLRPVPPDQGSIVYRQCSSAAILPNRWLRRDLF